MAEACDIAPITGETSLKLVSIGVGNSFGHREWQASSGEDMAAIDGADEWIDEAENVGRILCVGREGTEC